MLETEDPVEKQKRISNAVGLSDLEKKLQEHKNTENLIEYLFQLAQSPEAKKILSDFKRRPSFLDCRPTFTDLILKTITNDPQALSKIIELGFPDPSKQPNVEKNFLDKTPEEKERQIGGLLSNFLGQLFGSLYYLGFKTYETKLELSQEQRELYEDWKKEKEPLIDKIKTLEAEVQLKMEPLKREKKENPEESPEEIMRELGLTSEEFSALREIFDPVLFHKEISIFSLKENLELTAALISNVVQPIERVKIMSGIEDPVKFLENRIEQLKTTPKKKINCLRSVLANLTSNIKTPVTEEWKEGGKEKKIEDYFVKDLESILEIIKSNPQNEKSEAEKQAVVQTLNANFLELKETILGSNIRTLGQAILMLQTELRRDFYDLSKALKKCFKDRGKLKSIELTGTDLTLQETKKMEEEFNI